jgi:ParB family chromosome partitioning protein
MKVDPRALKENPDRTRQTKSTPQADALLLATIKAVGIVQPPVITPESGGGNGFIINAGHRRVKQAIAAGLEEIDVLVDEAANDNGAMRSMIENIAREALNPVDQWRAIERLVALGWTEEAIGVALALPVRQIRKLRLLANVLPAMLDHMAKGDMPDERQLRTIAAASLDEQKEVWKKHKPSKADPQVSWWSVAQALQKTRMYARHASFDDDLAQAYGIQWVEDLFAPADEDSRYTTNVEAFLGAQQEWMANNLPKKGVIAETTNWGEVKLPPKAERVYGKPAKSDCTAMYLDRDGRVQTVHYRMPAAKKPKGKAASGSESAPDDVDVISKPRPDVTRKGVEMIGDFRTDALRDALGRAPIEDDTLMALLILAFAGQNVSVTTGSGGFYYGHSRLAKHAAVLFDADGKLVFDMDTLRIAARAMLSDVLSCRENATNSGVVARVAGATIGADTFLPNMGTDDFLSSLSRPALEASCKDTPVLPRQRVKDTRAALVEHFKEGHFVHPAALFAPNPAKLADWLTSGASAADDADDSDEADEGTDGSADDASDEDVGAFREAAE